MIFHIIYTWLKPQALILFLTSIIYLNILLTLNSQKFISYLFNASTGNTTATLAGDNSDSVSLMSKGGYPI